MSLAGIFMLILISARGVVRSYVQCKYVVLY